jgi:hypothetical protein
MKRAIFWGSLLAANGLGVLFMFLDRCDCGGPDGGDILWRFATGGGIFAAVFSLLSLPFGLAWRALAGRWPLWRPLPVPELMLASALLGSALYGFLEHRWIQEERYESVNRG